MNFLIETFFANALTNKIILTVFFSLCISLFIIIILHFLNITSDKKHHELMSRTKSWFVICSVIFIPLLLGKFATIFAICILSLACFHEYAHATGLFRERLIVFLNTIATIILIFSVADNWYGFFSALASLSLVVIAAIPILQDRPQGYIQRIALAVFGFMFFAYSFGYIAFIANDLKFQHYILFLFLAVELNDIAAYVSGHLFGKIKLLPNTSPGKTREGAIGAIIFSIIFSNLFGHIIFASTAIDDIYHLSLLGFLLSISGQLGDLMLSSVKRDIGIKDLGVVIPGHGGLLDRFDSLILAAPTFFHFVGYYLGFGLDQPLRIFSSLF